MWARGLLWISLGLLALLCQSTEARPFFQAPLPRDASQEAALLSSSEGSSTVADPYPTLPLLSFGKDGKFKLAVFSDTHMLDGQTNPGA